MGTSFRSCHRCSFRTARLSPFLRASHRPRRRGHSGKQKAAQLALDGRFVRGESHLTGRIAHMGINYIIKCWPWFLLALIIGAGLGW